MICNYNARVVWKYSVFVVMLLTLLLTISYVKLSRAQENTRLFPETGKTVTGEFLSYWNNNGGITQQGFPISETMQEASDNNGKTYTVQYFERAVFEMHSENAPPNHVLLQLLGVFRYRQKYKDGPSEQTANMSTGSLEFPETGKHLGGQFLEYWKAHGAISQQGYPISDEFQEKSDLDGKLYTVQYFERAVFEAHPLNQPPYNVLLSQLGTFRYKTKYLQPITTSTSVRPVVTPSAIAITEADCSEIPASQNLIITPKCAPAGSVFFSTGSGFQPGEEVSVYTTRRDGRLVNTSVVTADNMGKVSDWQVGTYKSDPQGIWATTMEGKVSGVKVIGYFRLLASVTNDCLGIPENSALNIAPNCIIAGEKLEIDIPRIPSYYETYCKTSSPSGKGEAIERRADGRFEFFSDLNTERGLWKVICLSNNSDPDVLDGYFKILPP